MCPSLFPLPRSSSSSSLCADFAPRRVVSPIGERTFVIRGVPLNFSVHVTILTSLTNGNNPVIVDLRRGTNTGFDFARFVAWAIHAGYLIAGDVLVVDGARVHFTRATRATLHAFMLHHGVRLPPLLETENPFISCPQ